MSDRTWSKSMRIRVYHHLDELPDRYNLLFDEAGAASFFQSRSWFRGLIGATSNAGEELRIYGVEADDEATPPLMLLVARAFPTRLGPIRQRELASFTNFYTMRGEPILATDTTDVDGVFRHLASAICSERPRWDVVSLEALDPNLPVFQSLIDAFRNAGMLVHSYFQHAVWFEEIAGRSYDEYINDRGSKFFKTLQWKNRKIGRSDRFSYELITDEKHLDRSIANYQKVYQSSWKEPELYPDFIPRLISECARLGTLRLSFMYLDGEPIATQLTFLSGKTAFQYKMAYDKDILSNSYTKNLSIGAIMQLRLIEHLIDVDKIEIFDFGVGDEDFKSKWCAKRGESWGVKAFNARTVPGLINALRHIGGAGVSSAWKGARKG